MTRAKGVADIKQWLNRRLDVSQFPPLTIKVTATCISISCGSKANEQSARLSCECRKRDDSKKSLQNSKTHSGI